MQQDIQKAGTILLVGRPNVGKSTFVNNVVGQKVAITSPKPQTTRFPIHALYQEERGTIEFIDTPGIFDRVRDRLSKRINQQTLDAVQDEVDAVIYMVDPSRRRDFEEGKVLGIVRKINKPKILVMNIKADEEDAEKYLPQYEFMRDEFDMVFKIDAMHKTHLRPLVDQLFELMPEKQEDVANFHEVSTENASGYPLLNLDSRHFIAELIREKIFLKMGEEIPYTVTVVVDEIKERTAGLMYIRARILTTDGRYKRMIIGAGGRKIKEMGAMARKEIALAINKKVYLDVTVEVDPHWQEVLY